MADTLTLNQNLRDYLTEKQKIGAMEGFPVKEILKEKTYDSECLGYRVKVTVKLAILSFGESKEYTVHGLVTDEVRVSHRLPLGGFGSYAFVDEGKVMEDAVAQFCQENDLMVCRKICTWPFAKVAIQPIPGKGTIKEHVKRIIN